VLVFLLLRLTPGDPAAILAGDAASSEQIAAIRASLGLDRSLPVQFGIWLGNMAGGDLGDVKNSKFDLQLRPMIGIYPPILPLYARAIFAFQNLLHSPRHMAIGAAAGIKIGLPFIGLGVFAEAGVLPRFASTTQMVVEGRLGAYWAF